MQPTTEPTLTELLQARDQHTAELIERAQRLDAELTVLRLYDTERHYRGHDYGNGQRARELRRVSRELDSALHNISIYHLSDDAGATTEQLADALRRISRDRLGRMTRGSATPHMTERSLAAWRAVADELARVARVRELVAIGVTRQDAREAAEVELDHQPTTSH